MATRTWNRDSVRGRVDLAWQYIKVSLEWFGFLVTLMNHDCWNMLADVGQILEVAVRRITFEERHEYDVNVCVLNRTAMCPQSTRYH